MRYRGAEGIWNETMSKAYGEELSKLKYEIDEEDSGPKKVTQVLGLSSNFFTDTGSHYPRASKGISLRQ